MRKRIALFMNELMNEFQEEVVPLIIEEANGLDYDVFVFAGYGSYNDNVMYAEGEKNLIKIPDLSTFDGIIVGDDTFDIYGMDLALSEIILRDAKCPTVYIRSGNVNFHSLVFDDVNNMSKITKYFIEEKGFSDICYMSGPKDMTDAMYRMQGFMEAMMQAGLQVTNKMIYEGTYWRNRGKQAVDFFMLDRDTYPQAIICANDQMALSVIAELESRGIRVPEDVCVSGYDNSIEARSYSPGITSIRIPIDEMCRKAVHIIDEVNKGNEVEKLTKVEGELVIRRSSDSGMLDEPIDNMEMINKINEQYDMSRKIVDISASCANTLTEEDVLRVAHAYYRFTRCQKGYLCFNNKAESEEMAEISASFSKKMILRGEYNESEEYTTSMMNVLFDRSKILPDEYLNEKASGYIVFPLHFMNNEYGYMVFNYGKGQWLNLFTHQYMNCLAASLDDIDKKSQLANAKRIEELYLLDPLTGLYNRRGFDQKFQKLYDKMKRMGGYMSVVSIDMDGLKYINDTFGHLEGDAALLKMSDILKGLVGNNDIAARFGGDEFCLLLFADSKSRHDNFRQIFENVIENVNASLDKEYTLHASMGMVCINDVPGLQMLAYMQIADKRMYEEKRHYKYSNTYKKQFE